MSSIRWMRRFAGYESSILMYEYALEHFKMWQL